MIFGAFPISKLNDTSFSFCSYNCGTVSATFFVVVFFNRCVLHRYKCATCLSLWWQCTDFEWSEVGRGASGGLKWLPLTQF